MQVVHLGRRRRRVRTRQTDRFRLLASGKRLGRAEDFVQMSRSRFISQGCEEKDEALCKQYKITILYLKIGFHLHLQGIKFYYNIELQYQ
jgi:hypothetical protein